MKFLTYIFLFCFPLLSFSQIETNNNSLNNNLLRLLQKERDTITNVSDGYTIFNLSSGCFNYYYKKKWWEICGTCEKTLPIVMKKEKKEDGFAFFMKPQPYKTTYFATTSPSSISIIDSTGVLHFTNVRKNTNYTVFIYTKSECGNSNTYTESYFYDGNDACDGINTLVDKRTNKQYTTSIYNQQCWLNSDLYFIPIGNEYQKEIVVSQDKNVYYSIELLMQGNICPTGWHIPNKSEVTTFMENYTKNKDNAMFFAPNGFYDVSIDDNKNKDQMFLFFNTNENDANNILNITISETKLVNSDGKNKYAIRCVKDNQK